VTVRLATHEDLRCASEPLVGVGVEGGVVQGAWDAAFGYTAGRCCDVEVVCDNYSSPPKHKQR